jgi:hypothetical protein
MSDLLLGLLGWLAVAVVVSLLISRFMRVPDALDPPTRLNYRRHLLPGYGQEEEHPPGKGGEPPPRGRKE